MKKYLNLIAVLLVLFFIFYFFNRRREGFRNSLVYIGHSNCHPFCNWQHKRQNKFLENDFGSHSIYETGLLGMPNRNLRNKRYSGVFKNTYQGSFQNSYPGYYN